jgi:alkylation response protein AidB-like acyl-CoA dehydrogenase
VKYELTDEQRDFAASLDALLGSSDTVAVARAWAAGDHAPGLKLWSRLADQGVQALLVPEDQDGLGATPVELVIAFEALGRRCVPGPWVETAAYLRVGDGSLATVAAPPLTPYALDADVADLVLVATPDGLCSGTVGEAVTSIDPTRRLFAVTPGDVTAEIAEDAFDLAALATAAQLLGAGERLLADSVTYVKQRTQFGRPIGSYQAIKHQLADVRIALDFARPLVFAAALGLDTGLVPRTYSTSERGRDVSAAKVAAGDAAYLASRVALQVHGAIGYTAEYDLSLWLVKIRALVSAWGTPSWHRARILDAITSDSRIGDQT